MAEDNDDITRYQNNEMSEKERNAFEKKALSDPFLSDALEGAEELGPEEFSADVESLSRKINRRRSLDWKMPLRIAAGILLFTTVGYLAYRNTPTEADRLALKSADSTAHAVRDSAKNLLTLAEPKAPTVSTEAEKQQPALDIKPVEQASTSAAPVSGAGALSQPQTVQATEPEITVMTVPAAADAEIKEAAESTKSKADESADQKTEAVPQEAIRAKRSSAGKQTITGQVTEAEDGIPLPGASVTDKETNTTTQTNFEGKYSIQVAPQNSVLQYSFNGLETLVVSTGDRSALDVELKDDATMRSEVVILRPETNVAGSRFTLAVPFGGIAEYCRYLESNRQVPKAALAAKVGGKVTIEFNVTPTGTLTGFATVKGLGYGCDEEVIRLIKTGPAWAPSSHNGIQLLTKVWVKLEF